MKNLVATALFLIFSLTHYSQNFTWINGTSSISATSNYGTMGVSAPSNSPGQRHGCAKWVDNNGDLWFFGGEAPSNSWWSDLWKYNITTNEWTWVRGANTSNSTGNYGTLGVPSPANDPGAREFASYWTDNLGNFWLYGGDGYGTGSNFGKLSDLWKYNPSTNEWTWVKGANTVSQPGTYGTQGVPAFSNLPSGRAESGHWTDASGNLWLFGGLGHSSTISQGRLNDLWKYDIGTNTWTWINGSNMPNPYGVYGALSVASPTNHPGGRYSMTCWSIGTDMYLFGGSGRDSATVSINTGNLNDLWKYTPSTNAWVWLGGSPFINATANYGILGVSNPATIPGPREGAGNWVDASNNVWLFGGINTTASPDIFFNDLFRYNTTLNEWTWMKGSNLPDQNGTYGTMGLSAPSNIPGARCFGTFWTDLNGKFWLFGGEGFDATSTSEGHMNDLWSFTTPCNPDSITVTPGKTICSGTHATLTAVNGGNTTVWYPTATSTSSISGGDTLALSSLTTAASQTVYTYYAEANSCTTAPRPSISITVNPLPTIDASGSATLACIKVLTTLTVTGASSYTWNTNPVQSGSSATVLVTSPNTTTYIVTGTDQNGCKDTTTLVVKYVSCFDGINEQNNRSAANLIYPNPSKGEFVLKNLSNQKLQQFSVINALGQKVFSQTINSEETIIKTDLIKGIYFYIISVEEKAISSGRLIIE